MVDHRGPGLATRWVRVHPVAVLQRRTQNFAHFKHLIDRIQHGRDLIQHDQHTKETSIHTCLHVSNPGFSDYTLPPPPLGTVTGAASASSFLSPLAALVDSCWGKRVEGWGVVLFFKFQLNQIRILVTGAVCLRAFCRGRPHAHSTVASQQLRLANKSPGFLLAHGLWWLEAE